MNSFVLVGILAGLSCTAVTLNIILVFLILGHSSYILGSYKWLLVTFTLFEAAYASLVFLTVPIQFIYDDQYIIFSYEAPLQSTPLGYLGPGLYCSFYEVYIILVVVMFIYRYVVLCHPKLTHKIMVRKTVKLIILITFLAVIVYCFVCGIFWCMVDTPSEKLKQALHDQFGVENFSHISYILLKMKTESDFVPFAGPVILWNHYVTVGLSFFFIFFCGVSIYRHISKISRDTIRLDLKTQKQIFLTLILQTLVPVVFCHIPAMIHMSFAFWPKGTSFVFSSPMLTISSTIPKILDPIIAVLCIQQYRTAVLNMLKSLIPGKAVPLGCVAHAEPSTNSACQ